MGKRVKYKFEEILDLAKNYEYLNDFMESNFSAYVTACKNKWIKDIAKIANLKRVQRDKLTLLQIEEIAKACKSRSEFQKKDRSAYNASRKMGILHIICSHMVKPSEIKNSILLTNPELADKLVTTSGIYTKRYVYVIENSDNTAYVGLSVNPKKRYSQHLTYNSVILEKSKSTNQILRICSDLLDSNDAQIMEIAILEQYKNNGWIMLNKAGAGSLGQGIKWTIESLKEEALKYDSLKDFSRTSAYSTICRLGILDEATFHMKRSKKSNKYTDNELIEISKKYKTIKDLRIHNESAYNVIVKSKYLKSLCFSHMSSVAIERDIHGKIVSKIPDEMFEFIKKDYDLGMNITKIAKKYNVTTTNIYNRFKI